MRQIVAVLGVMAVLAGVAASGATADPSDLKLRIDGQAELISPWAVRLAVSYDCPVSFGTAELEAAVSQRETGAFANTGEFRLEVPCTGKWETLIETLGSPGPDPPAFVLGAAEASVIIVAATQDESRGRKVRIVA